MLVVLLQAALIRSAYGDAFAWDWIDDSVDIMPRNIGGAEQD
jgi:hypothetical protein